MGICFGTVEIDLYELQKMNLPDEVERENQLYQIILRSTPSTQNFLHDDEKVIRNFDTYFMKCNGVCDCSLRTLSKLKGNINRAKLEIDRDRYADLLRILTVNRS